MTGTATLTGEDIAARALATVSLPFRLHGRDPATGLDCIGLASHALATADHVPTGYRFAGTATPWLAWLKWKRFRKIARRESKIGDLWLVQPGRRQHHAMIAVAGGFVHAHAGLGRVVLLTPPCEWPVTAVFRAPWLD